MRADTGELRWITARTHLHRNAEGQFTGSLGAQWDVTAEQELVQQQAVLVAELQHRTRNLLGVVRSIASRMLRKSTGLSEFRERFEDRLLALARVQGLLSRLEGAERISFDHLLQTGFSALDADMSRISLDGPKGILLRSSTVQTLAFAIHELMTNALKYGALNQPQGKLNVSWKYQPHGEDGLPWLYVGWRESDVVLQRTSSGLGTGFGRELIERALPHQLSAKTTYVIAEDGVRCTILLPVSERTTRIAHG